MGTAEKTLIPEMRSTCSSDSIRGIPIVLMSVGLQDDVYPPRTSFATYNTVTSLKEVRVYPFAGHGDWREHGELKDAWMAKMLGVEVSGL